MASRLLGLCCGAVLCLVMLAGRLDKGMAQLEIMEVVAHCQATGSALVLQLQARGGSGFLR